LDKARGEDLFRFIWGVLKERKCHLYRIGGIEDHTLTLQERSWAGFVHHARVFPAVCEVFHKQTCDFRTICDPSFNKPATPLYDAQLGGHFCAHKARGGLGS
jgi:hypothetical protein